MKIMDLYRFRIVPESPWLTPWQSDTLAGLLCWACARHSGDSVLQEEIIKPALGGSPRFVLSDAFPGDYLPLPMSVRAADWPPEERKRVKRATWVTRETFQEIQRGQHPAAPQLIEAEGTRGYSQLRNTIARSGGSTAVRGGLFPKEEWVLDGPAFLTVYARVEPTFLPRLSELLRWIGETGFGADVSSGKGQFRIEGGLEESGWFDEPADASGVAVLSTFQPSEEDPVEGYWDCFTKYGKLGPDFGMDNVFKRPMIMLRPGACFRVSSRRAWVGRAIPGFELLSPPVEAEMRKRGVSIVHLAHGLCVPLQLKSV